MAIRRWTVNELLDQEPAEPTKLPKRERLPDTRRSVTHKFKINDQEGYIIVGYFDDGRPGEVFVKIAKHGSTISGLVDTIAVLTSTALQYGVPVETLARQFAFTRVDPSGLTSNPDLRRVNSIVDYLFRCIGNECSEEFRSEQSAKALGQVEVELSE